MLWLERASQQLENFVSRIKPPSRFSDLARLVVEQAEACIGWMDADPTDILKMLKQVDALRRPERSGEFLEVLSVAGASRGTRVELAPLARLAQLLRDLDVSDAVASADSSAIGARVDAERLRAIEKWLANGT